MCHPRAILPPSRQSARCTPPRDPSSALTTRALGHLMPRCLRAHSALATAPWAHGTHAHTMPTIRPRQPLSLPRPCPLSAAPIVGQSRALDGGGRDSVEGATSPPSLQISAAPAASRRQLIQTDPRLHPTPPTSFYHCSCRRRCGCRLDLIALPRPMSNPAGRSSSQRRPMPPGATSRSG